MINNFFFFRKSCLYEIMWKKYCRAGQATDDNMAHAHCWIPMATNTHSGCLNVIAFPLQQWLHERASMLLYTYIASLF